jgi:S1-C subfamily serine protease
VLERTPPYVEEVDRGSPAAKSGLKPDDLIVYADGVHINSIKLFKEVVNNLEAGVEVTLEVQRGKDLVTIKVKLAPLPKSDEKK